MLATIICADWSKAEARRAAYIADVTRRTIRRLRLRPLSFDALVAHAHAAASMGPVLLGIDAPIGAPSSFLAPTHSRLGVTRDTSFPCWLEATAAYDGFFTPHDPNGTWSPLRPFIAVPAGSGSRTRLFEAMRRAGVEPYRDVDRRTGAMSPFIVSGTPGSVGSSVIDLWPAIAKARRAAKGELRLWPFEVGHPGRGSRGVVLAEVYPRVMYALALAPGPPKTRSRLKIDKTNACCRQAALGALLRHDWLKAHGVAITDAGPEIGEDDFDALMSTAATLRCVLEKTPLANAFAHPFEGGLLGLDSLDIAVPERRFDCGTRHAKRRSAGPEPVRSPLERPRDDHLPGYWKP